MGSGETDCRLEHCSEQTERLTNSQGQTDTQTDGAAHKKTGALFFNLAQADKSPAFRDLSAASVQVHYLDD